MLFKFLNVDEMARALIQASADFAEKYPTLTDAIQYLKEQSVMLYEQHYAEAGDPRDVADGVLHVPIWKNVGATYCAVPGPNHPHGDEWPLKFSTPGAVYIEVNLWASLPLS